MAAQLPTLMLVPAALVLTIDGSKYTINGTWQVPLSVVQALTAPAATGLIADGPNVADSSLTAD